MTDVLFSERLIPVPVENLYTNNCNRADPRFA